MGFNIGIKTDLDEVYFLGVNFNLRKVSYKKSNDIAMYIHTPFKKIPQSIKRRLSDNYSSEIINEDKEVYEMKQS